MQPHHRPDDVAFLHFAVRRANVAQGKLAEGQRAAVGAFVAGVEQVHHQHGRLPGGGFDADVGAVNGAGVGAGVHLGLHAGQGQRRKVNQFEAAKQAFG